MKAASTVLWGGKGSYGIACPTQPVEGEALGATAWAQALQGLPLLTPYLISKTSRTMCVVSRSLTSLPSMVTRTVPVGGGGSFRTTTSGNGCACAYTTGGSTSPRAIFFCQPGGSALPDAGFLRCLLRMSTLCCCTISFSSGVISTCSQGGSDAGAAAEEAGGVTCGWEALALFAWAVGTNKSPNTAQSSRESA